MSSKGAFLESAGEKAIDKSTSSKQTKATAKLWFPLRASALKAMLYLLLTPVLNSAPFVSLED